MPDLRNKDSNRWCHLQLHPLAAGSLAATGRLGRRLGSVGASGVGCLGRPGRCGWVGKERWVWLARERASEGGERSSRRAEGKVCAAHSIVLHLHLDNKHDRVSAKHSLLRTRLCGSLLLTADPSCVHHPSSLGKHQFLQNSNYTPAVWSGGNAALVVRSHCGPHCGSTADPLRNHCVSCADPLRWLCGVPAIRRDEETNRIIMSHY